MKLRSLSLILISLGLLGAAACGGKSKDAADPAGNGGGDGEPVATDGKAPITGVLNAAQAGDVACYLTLTTDDGPQELMATFDVCPEPDTEHPLVGQTVTVTFERGSVMAASCEGNPDCPDSEEVDLVNSITAAP